jgi:type III secretion protein V
MDGAMNFVKGDAIAGILIIFTNIFGGIYMGLSSGLSLSDAIQTYTVLTVGDGLVTQIPSLLTSICAGIIVTRVSTSDRSSLSADLNAQLFSQPFTLIATAGVLVVVSLMPGIPMLPFLLAAAGLVAIGLAGRRRSQTRLTMQAQSDSEGTDGLGAGSDSDSVDATLVLVLDKGSLFRTYRARAVDYSASWRRFRESFFEDTGILLPLLRVISDDLLPPGSYIVRHMGVEVLSGSVPDDALLVEVSSAQSAVLGFKVLKEEDHPASGHRLFWTPRTSRNLEMLQAARVRFYDFLEFIALRIAQATREHPEDAVSVTYVHSLLRQIEKKHPGLVGDGFGREFVSVPKLAEIVQELIRQGVSIRDFRSIMECIAAYCASSGVTTNSETPVDLAEVVHFVRASRRRQIVRRFVGGMSSLPVLTLSPIVEQNFEEASADRWTSSLAMAPDLYDTLLRGLYAVVRPTLQAGCLPIALLCSRDVKEKVIAFVRMSGLQVFVTTLDEIDPSFPVMQIGVWDAKI